MSTHRAALKALIEAVATPLEADDLGRLARMHSYCQTLAESPEPEAPDVREALHTLAAALVNVLEKLVLAEAAQPDRALARIPGAVECLQAALDGRTVEIEPFLAGFREAIGAAGSGAGGENAQPAPAGGTNCPSAGASAARPAKDPANGVQPAAQPERAAPAVKPERATPAVSAEQPVEAPAYVSEPLVPDLTEAEHLTGFIEESQEHMEAIEAALLDAERDPSDPAHLNELFRPFHTIKGIAGFLNLRDINRLAHEVETILDMGRKGTLAIDAPIVNCILGAVDFLKIQIANLRDYLAQPQGASCPQPDIRDIIARLRAIASGKGLPAAPAPAPAIAADAPAPASPVGSAEPDDSSAGEPLPKLGEVLVSTGAATRDEIAAALAAQRTAPGQKLGDLLVSQGVVSRKQLESALADQAPVPGSASVDASIRVDTSKLDALVDAVGELVIAQTMVSMSKSVSHSGDPMLIRNVAQVAKIVRDVQETSMSLRMIPVRATFQKMRRLVRDVSQKASKKVELHISGEGTELDKTVIQQIADPLIHMIRNAVDHGVETPDVRRAAGKDETGHVYLDAYHQGDSIVIEVRDDGRGLDPQKLIAKGIERGLVQPGEPLTDQQAYALIMQAGFSTAEQVTDISGRGVGMDVVRRNIEQLRGKLEIQSQVGDGTTFLIRLPLTLAIIDGMMVRVGEERLIIPTILIEHSLRPQRKQITTVQQRGAMLAIRGELCPLVQVGALFGYSGTIDPSETLVVVVNCDGRKAGLVVHELIDQQQVVIKSLSTCFKQVKGISGAAILGDGRVGLILEPSGLLQLHDVRRIANDSYAGGQVKEWDGTHAAEVDRALSEDESENAVPEFPTSETAEEPAAPEPAELVAAGV